MSGATQPWSPLSLPHGHLARPQTRLHSTLRLPEQQKKAEWKNVVLLIGVFRICYPRFKTTELSINHSSPASSPPATHFPPAAALGTASSFLPHSQHPVPDTHVGWCLLFGENKATLLHSATAKPTSLPVSVTEYSPLLPSATYTPSAVQPKANFSRQR